jgi:hypothetical protein
MFRATSAHHQVSNYLLDVFRATSAHHQVSNYLLDVFRATSTHHQIGNKNYQKLHKFVISLNCTEMHGTKNIKTLKLQ